MKSDMITQYEVFFLIGLFGVCALFLIIVYMTKISVAENRIKIEIEKNKGQLLTLKRIRSGKKRSRLEGTTIFEATYLDKNGNTHQTSAVYVGRAGVFYSDDKIIEYADPTSPEYLQNQVTELSQENDKLLEELAIMKKTRLRRPDAKK